MTPDETIDPLDRKEDQTPDDLRLMQQRNRSMMSRRVEAAEKWKAEHKKNAMLFPLAFD